MIEATRNGVNVLGHRGLGQFDPTPDIESSSFRPEAGVQKPGNRFLAPAPALASGLWTPAALLVPLQNRPIRGVLHRKPGRLDVSPEAVCRAEVAILSGNHTLPKPRNRPDYLLHFLRAKSFRSNRFWINAIGGDDKPQGSWLQVQDVHDQPEHLTAAFQHRDVSPLT